MRAYLKAPVLRPALAAAMLSACLFVPQSGFAQSNSEATSLAQCPPRKPVLRVAGVYSSEKFSPHPVETRFSSTDYAHLYSMPLFGADPWEEKVDGQYGAAKSWKFLPHARGILIKLHKGLTFNDGEPVTAKDVVFSLKLFESKFADDQVAAALRGIGIKPKVVDKYDVRVDFSKGSITFPEEFSTLVFPIYVISAKYHSNGTISQAAVDKFRANPLAAGPYKVIAHQTQRYIILKAARKDPLLGCPTYDRVEIRNIPETGTRMAQFRTGELDIVEGNRDLIQQAKSYGAHIMEKPAANMIGLYFFQTYLTNSVTHDERVRKAAAYAIDHKLIAETLWKGIGVHPWGCTWPPSTEISVADPAYVKACGKPYPYDPAKAKQLLAQAGYSASKPAPLKLVFWGNYPNEQALAEAMQPMLNAVGFKATIDKIDRVEFRRMIKHKGFGNSVMFFGPGGRVTSLAGSYFVYHKPLGPIQDKDVQNALARASHAETLKAYMAATAELGRLAHDRAYSPGFFSASSVYFARKGIPDWGLNRSRGRGPINLVPLVTNLKP